MERWRGFKSFSKMYWRRLRRPTLVFCFWEALGDTKVMVLSKSRLSRTRTCSCFLVVWYGIDVCLSYYSRRQISVWKASGGLRSKRSFGGKMLIRGRVVTGIHLRLWPLVESSSSCTAKVVPCVRPFLCIGWSIEGQFPNRLAQPLSPRVRSSCSGRNALLLLVERVSVLVVEGT